MGSVVAFSTQDFHELSSDIVVVWCSVDNTFREDLSDLGAKWGYLIEPMGWCGFIRTSTPFVKLFFPCSTGHKGMAGIGG